MRKDLCRTVQALLVASTFLGLSAPSIFAQSPTPIATPTTEKTPPPKDPNSKGVSRVQLTADLWFARFNCGAHTLLPPSNQQVYPDAPDWCKRVKVLEEQIEALDRTEGN